MPLFKDHDKALWGDLHHGLHPSPHARSPRHRIQSQVGRDQAAHDQKDHLDHVRPRHGTEPAVQAVRCGKQGEPHDAIHHGHTHDGFQGQRPEIEDRGQVDKHVQRDPKDRQNRFQLGAVALLDKLRDGVQALLNEDGQEVLAHHQQGQGRHPFVRGDGQAQREATARHPDELFCTDVGGNQAGADRPPWKAFAGKEIVLGTFLLAVFGARDPKSHAQNQQGISNENRVVEGRKRRVHEGKVRR